MTNICHTHHKCIDEAIKKAKALCHANKVFLTPLRQAILELIWQSHSPLKAYDILKQLKATNSSARPITIYRSLDFLIENKMIHKIESQNSFFGCSHPGEHRNCYFTICQKCRAVKELCNDEFSSRIQEQIKKSNFQTKNIILEIQGLCSDCRQPINKHL